MWSNIYFHIYPVRSDRYFFIHRFIPVFWHDFLTLIGYRVHIFEEGGRGRGPEGDSNGAKRGALVRAPSVRADHRALMSQVEGVT